MRLAFLVLSALLFAAPVRAEPLRLAKGMWSTSTDVYLYVTAEGEPVDAPADHSTEEECWSTDEEVTIDEGMVAMFEGCVSAGSWSTTYSFDMDLVCEFEGVPMTGAATFVVNKGGDGYAGQLFLTGSSDVLEMEVEGLILGHRTGACTAPE
jgi:hypothetical protein